jgi:cell fate (sporulation/competence/biofilm development) regulator YlbF (YheA/YmcA/DUF963 family)
MNVNEQAEILGKALSETDIFKRYIFAKSKFEANEDLTALIEAYNMEKLRLDVIEAQGTEEEKKSSCTDKLNKIYQDIFSNPDMIEYNQAHEALSDLLESVNTIILNTMNGDTGCTPDKCASCGHCH